MQLRVNCRVAQPSFDRFSDSKVDHLRHRHAVVQGDENVRWFEVAMNDALLMRMLDGVANLCEQFQPLLCGEIILVAVLRDFDPAHQFHDEVRPATRKGGWSGVPLTRPAGTLYPIGGEGWGEGALG